jgi:MFS family permease
MPPDSHAGTLFRHRNFVLLWGGQAISLIGNGIFVVALPLTVLHLTSSPLALALVVSGQVIATVVLLLVGGAVVDRLPRRFLMLTADAVCGISVSLVAVLVVSGVARLWELFVLTLIFGAAGAFFKPAATAIVRDILPADLLVPASSLRSVSQSLSGLVIGPLTGGLIVATAGAGWAFGIDGASFAVSAACLASMRNVPRVKATSTRILEGVACSIVALGIGNLVIFYPFFILVPLLVKNVFHGGAFALGIFFAANGAGSLVASLATARRGMPSRPVMTIWTTCAAAGACLALVGASPWFWVSVFFTGLGLGLVSYANILWFPLVQHETPAELLGRVSSIDWLFSLAFSPLGALAAAAAAATFGVRAALIAGGMIAVATGSVLFVPGVRAPDKRNEATVQAATRSLQADETVLEAFS